MGAYLRDLSVTKWLGVILHCYAIYRKGMNGILKMDSDKFYSVHQRTSLRIVISFKPILGYYRHAEVHKVDGLDLLLVKRIENIVMVVKK
jgi:hypothetical protein